MPENQPFISIITVNYNQIKVTTELLDSLRKSAYRHFEVFVVDNGSDDDPFPLLTNQYPEVNLIQSHRNLGFAGGNNLAIKEAKGDYLFFINNDAEILEDTLGTLVNLFDKIPNLGVVSPMIYYHPSVLDEKIDEEMRTKVIQYAGTTPVHFLTARNRTIGEREIDEGQFDKPAPTAYAHGAAMMVSRAVIEKVGMMPEDFFLYYEELDWCEQIRRAGFELYVEPKAKIYHKESFTVLKMNSLKSYYINRNRILFMRRNRKKWQVIVFGIFFLLISVPKNTLTFLLKGEMANLMAFYSGVRDGFRNVTGYKAF